MRTLIYFFVLGLVSLSSLTGASPTARDSAPYRWQHGNFIEEGPHERGDLDLRN